MNILVLNCGSSSIKYQLLNMCGEPKVIAKGLVEKIGLPMGGFKLKGTTETYIEKPIPDHNAGLELILNGLTDPKIGVLKSLKEINAVGHRVVHGGEKFAASTVIDENVIKAIEECNDLAPLHNPANLVGIRACQKIMPGVPMVAVFDTAFHQTMPDYAFTYGIPYECYKEYGVRRYGFHGTSHKFVAEQACKFLGKDINKTKIITCHLGNGASITAIKNGKSIDTSMGFTPVAGLVMGTRCGDLDVGALTYLGKKNHWDASQMDKFTNKEGGVFGISGVSSDFRDLDAAIAEGNNRAQLALDVFIYNVKKFVGAYAAVLNGVDLIVFTGGIGEYNYKVRKGVCSDMEYLGVKFDAAANDKALGCDMVISTPDSKVTVMVKPTNEELVIATDTLNLIQK